MKDNLLILMLSSVLFLIFTPVCLNDFWSPTKRNFEVIVAGSWSRASFEGAPAPASKLFAILTLLQLQLRSWLKRAAPLRLQLRVT